MGDQVSDFFGGVTQGAGDLIDAGFDGIKDVAGGVADVAGNLGGAIGDALHLTGQPGEGLPAATQHMMSQATPLIENVADGAGKAASGIMSVASALPEGSYGIEDIFDPNAVADSSLLDRMIGGAKTVAPLAVLGTSLYKANQDIPGAKEMERTAKDAAGRAAQLGDAANAAFAGNLPGGRQVAFDNQANREKAAIRQRYAGMGMSGSTAEAQDLAAVDQRLQEQAFREAQQMATTGFNAAAQQSGISDELYKLLWEEEARRGTAFSNSLSSFVSAIAGQGV